MRPLTLGAALIPGIHTVAGRAISKWAGRVGRGFEVHASEDVASGGIVVRGRRPNGAMFDIARLDPDDLRQRSDDLGRLVERAIDDIFRDRFKKQRKRAISALARRLRKSEAAADRHARFYAERNAA